MSIKFTDISYNVMAFIENESVNSMFRITTQLNNGSCPRSRLNINLLFFRILKTITLLLSAEFCLIWYFQAIIYDLKALTKISSNITVGSKAKKYLLWWA
jgi:hypothetical protein